VGVPMLEAVVFGVFLRSQRASSSVTNDVREWWQTYFALQQVRVENMQLKEELAQVRVRLQEERALAQQSHTLQQLSTSRPASRHRRRPPA